MLFGIFISKRELICNLVLFSLIWTFIFEWLHSTILVYIMEKYHGMLGVYRWGKMNHRSLMDICSIMEIRLTMLNY